MTLTADPVTVESARDRGGDVDPDRPEDVDATLSREELGHGQGSPIVGGVSKFHQYPDPEEMSDPKYGTLLRCLMEHPFVGGYDDCVTELTGAKDTVTLRNYRSALENAAGAFGFDVPTLFSQGQGGGEQGRESRLSEILGYEPPTDLVAGDNPLVVSELYTLGLSVAEISDILSDHVEDDVREAQVRDTLRTTGLLGGQTRGEERNTFEENKGRLGGTTVTPLDSDDGDDEGTDGLIVRTSDF